MVAASGDSFNVQFSGVQSAADNLQNLFNQLATAVNDLENQRNTLSATWNSDAPALWVQTQNRWNQKMTDAGRTIGMLSGHLQYAHETWHGAEHTNMGIWS